MRITYDKMNDKEKIEHMEMWLKKTREWKEQVEKECLDLMLENRQMKKLLIENHIINDKITDVE